MMALGRLMYFKMKGSQGTFQRDLFRITQDSATRLYTQRAVYTLTDLITTTTRKEWTKLEYDTELFIWIEQNVN